MATAVAFSFPLGRYHGNPWGHNVNEGAVDWPPEPWRILRALLATAYKRCPEFAEDEVFRVLARLTEPPIYRVPQYQLAHTRHYLPDREHRSGLKGGTDKVLDAFAVCDPASELVTVWPTDLTDRERVVLGVLCDRLPYLGRAESLCDARLLEVVPEHDADRCAEPIDRSQSAMQDSATRAVDLLAPVEPLDAESLVLRTVQIRKKKRIDPPSTRRVTYSVPAPGKSDGNRRRVVAPRAKVTAVRYRITGNALPSKFALVAMTDALRDAALSHYGKRDEGGRSATLAGKNAEGSPLRDHLHAHYLGFAADTDRRGDRQIDTLVVWAPGGLSPTEVAALASIRKLRGYEHVKDFRPCLLGVEGIGDIHEVAPELVGSSTTGASRWKSQTPVGIDRHPRRNADIDAFVRTEVERGLEHARLPAAVEIGLRRGDALSFRRHRNKEGLHRARRAFFVDLELSKPIEGPVCLGALNHFGLGLFVPVGAG